MYDFFWFSDSQWARIAPLLPTDVRSRKRVDDRRVPSGIVHALRCGGRQADCADIHGPNKTLCNRFVRRADRGIREGIFSAPAGAEDTPDRLFIDRSCIKAHRCAGGGKRGPWPMVSVAPKADATPGSTPSATTRAAPCFVNCVLLPTPGNVHDCKVAQRRIEAMPPSAERVAGKGRDGRELRERLEGRGTGPVIPPRKNRKIRYHDDRAIQRERDIIERMFCRLKDRRRIATRFERNIENVMAVIARVAAAIWWL